VRRPTGDMREVGQQQHPTGGWNMSVLWGVDWGGVRCQTRVPRGLEVVVWAARTSGPNKGARDEVFRVNCQG